ncbi:MAG: DUF4157 domain-containing protein [Actinomycetota bacterium]|nr:DUF4157 domain-containing protein [Actinomycetota bacterium]
MGLGLGDVVGAVTGGIGDVVDAIGDTAEDAIDAVEEAVGDAVDAVDDALDDVFDAIEDTLDEMSDSLGDLGADIGDIADDAWDSFADFAENAWDTTAAGLEDALDALAQGVEDGWEAASAAIEATWEGLEAAVESGWSELSEVAEATWERIEQASEEAWETATAAVLGAAGALAGLVEMSIELMARVVEFLGDLAEQAWELIKQLGACMAGVLILQITKTDNVVENFWKVPKLLPASYRADIEPFFGDRSFWNVWYIEDARLAADWYNDTTDAMTMSGVTLAGVTLSHLIFLTDPWNESNGEDRKLMAHELVHVLQYRRLVTDPAFGCAYGIGYENAGFDYFSHPMETAAYDFVSANAAAIAAT